MFVYLQVCVHMYISQWSSNETYLGVLIDKIFFLILIKISFPILGLNYIKIVKSTSDPVLNTYFSRYNNINT